VVRVGVLGDVEVALDLASWVGKEQPLRAERLAHLVGLEDRVGGDGDDLRVSHGDLRIQLDEPAVLLKVLGAVVASRQDEDHRVAALNLAQPMALPVMAHELVVWKYRPIIRRS
jgi:hypothetical protein